MPRVAVASSSQIAADAGARVAAAGGNAVDAAIAAVLVSVVTEPGVCSLGGGGFITIWPYEQEPLTIDGNVEMPGRGLPPERFGQGGIEVEMAYGGGMRTIVGPGSVGTPGALAALDLAWRRFGSRPWAELVEDAYRWARDGFPLSEAAWRYLQHSHEVVFGLDPDGWAALHHADGTLLAPDELVVVPGLAQTLRRIADEGADVLYRGDLAEAIAQDLLARGGILTAEDLAAYRPVVRPSLRAQIDGWQVATNPPPSVGGVALVAMLRLMRELPGRSWDVDALAHLIRVQEAVFRYRRRWLDPATDLDEPARRLLDLTTREDWYPALTSASTVHTSTMDSTGLACAITLSAGYGSGVIPARTGIWMNNSLGEIELNHHGFHALAPGTRLHSNMAPTTARREDGAALAIGSPGADRITTAIQQSIVHFAHRGLSLQEAVAHPRLHVDLIDEDRFEVAYEAPLPVDRLGLPSRRFDRLDMYFGGVGAALGIPPDRFEVGADPRRTGGTAIAGER